MLELIIIAGFLFIITFLAFKVIKNAITVVIMITALLLITVVTGSLLVFFDAKSLKENTSKSDTTIIFTDNNYEKVFSGFNINLGNTTKNIPFEHDKIAFIQKNLNSKNYDIVKNSSYKLIIIPIDSLNEILDERIILSEKSSIKKEDFFKIIESEDATQTYINIITDEFSIGDVTSPEIQQSIKNLFLNNSIDSEELKSKLSYMIFYNIMMKYPEKIILEYKQKNIIIYPETILLKLIRLIPDKQIKEQFEKIKEKITSQISSKVNNTLSNAISDTLSLKNKTFI